MPWQYLKSSLAGEDQIGPVSDVCFVQAIRDGYVKPRTKVNGGQATNGGWVEARSAPYFVKAVTTVKAERSLAAAQKKSAAIAHKTENSKRDRAISVARQDEVAAMQQGRDIAFATSRATRTSSIGTVAGIAAQILGGIGFLIGFVLLFSSGTIMHEILAVLVFGFSMLTTLGGVALLVLAEISVRSAAQYWLDKQ